MNADVSTMTLTEAMVARRAVRAYTGERLPRNTVVALLEAAVLAPTAVHEECWAFVVVQDANMLARLSERAKPLFAEQMHREHLDHGGHGLEALARPGFNIFYDAGTLVVICGPSHRPFAVADCWLAAENLMLAACAKGLGTCVIGSAVGVLNLPEVRDQLKVPLGFAAIAPIVVGVPRGATPATSRKAPRILAWW